MGDAGGVTLQNTKIGDKAGCRLLTDIDGNGASLADILDTMQTSIEACGSLVDVTTLKAITTKKCVGVVWDATGGVGKNNSYNIGISLPDNARVVRSWYEVLITFTSATDAAVIGIGIPTDDVAGIVAGVAISAGGNAWDAGLHEGIQLGTMATAGEKTTAARNIVVEVGNQEDLTAGKLFFYCEYVVTE